MLPRYKQRFCCCRCLRTMFLGSRISSRVTASSSVHPLLRLSTLSDYYLLLLYYVCTALLNRCVPGVALACMRCVPRITRGVPSSLLFVGSPRFCAAEAFFAVSVTAKIQQYAFILTLTNRKQCLPKSRKSINATHSFIGVRFFHIF